MRVKELIKQLKKMPQENKVRISVDISTCDDDFGRRAFGEEFSAMFSDGAETTVCFEGELND